jgi:hypothetical protein
MRFVPLLLIALASLPAMLWPVSTRDPRTVTHPFPAFIAPMWLGVFTSCCGARAWVAGVTAFPASRALGWAFHP